MAATATASCTSSAHAAADADDTVLTLYQYEVCPWCNKVKATLDYRQVPYRTIEVHPVFKSELKWSDYKKVPILLLPNNDSMTESTHIVDFVFEQYGSKEQPERRGCALVFVHGPVRIGKVSLLPLTCECKATHVGKSLAYPHMAVEFVWLDVQGMLAFIAKFDTFNHTTQQQNKAEDLCRLFGSTKGKRPSEKQSQAQLAEEQQWRTWADERLVKVLTANLYATLKESYQAMEYIMDVDSFSYFSQITGYTCGGAIMWLVGRRLPKKYGLEGKDLRAELIGLVNEFVDAGVPFCTAHTMYIMS